MDRKFKKDRKKERPKLRVCGQHIRTHSHLAMIRVSHVEHSENRGRDREKGKKRERKREREREVFRLLSRQSHGVSRRHLRSATKVESVCTTFGVASEKKV